MSELALWAGAAAVVLCGAVLLLLYGGPAPAPPSIVEAGAALKLNYVPSGIEELSPLPAQNRPLGCDTALGPGCVTDDHIRMAYACIAQLNARVKDLEAKLAEK